MRASSWRTRPLGLPPGLRGATGRPAGAWGLPAPPAGEVSDVGDGGHHLGPCPEGVGDPRGALHSRGSAGVSLHRRPPGRRPERGHADASSVRGRSADSGASGDSDGGSAGSLSRRKGRSPTSSRRGLGSPPRIPFVVSPGSFEPPGADGRTVGTDGTDGRVELRCSSAVAPLERGLSEAFRAFARPPRRPASRRSSRRARAGPNQPSHACSGRRSSSSRSFTATSAAASSSTGSSHQPGSDSSRVSRRPAFHEARRTAS